MPAERRTLPRGAGRGHRARRRGGNSDQGRADRQQRYRGRDSESHDTPCEAWLNVPVSVAAAGQHAVTPPWRPGERG
ncbi:hypothetical protein KCH_40630 [Kitasatospora cheerisanensis KCTC 2395]|uniref:Uncharacterized protein n=1 Tax=Kitasatospora cheerisanensis KCTC 2395 TaxID=1348663 RepID=A0A066YST3_9ACTN|nr:hypothetical protein KCH_40630 [Kitasatospora cheerisanensis KCTC 2395]